MSPNPPTSHPLMKMGFRQRWQAKFILSPYPIQAAGFTLIELSIVIVIIGLLVGGTLVGRDMIRAAQMNSIASDQQKLLTAINTYRLKYNGIPGDDVRAFNFFGASCCPDTAVSCNGNSVIGAFGSGGNINYCNGNGDRTFNNIAISVWPGSYSAEREAIMIWRHLAPLLSGLYTTGKNGIAGVNIPETGFKAGMHLIGNTSGDGMLTFPTNSLLIGEYPTSSHSTGVPRVYSSWTNQEQQGFDKKYDDGLPLTGKIRGGGMWPLYCATSSSVNTWRTASQGCFIVYADWL